ncbi:MAG: hypothetical protein HUJ56_02725, partial [Erysipelotrichaceae bacterium]|nr:hypothetical protein [Erysipelotrichaceae bacterium]
MKVNRADLTLKIDGTKVYGDNTYGIANNSEGKTNGSGVTLDTSGLKSTDTLDVKDMLLNVDLFTDNDTEDTYRKGIHLDVTNKDNDFENGYLGEVKVDLKGVSTVDDTKNKAVVVKNWGTGEGGLSTADTLADPDKMQESDVKEGFNLKNYNLTTTNVYTVTPRTLTFDIDGTKTYGEVTRNGRYSEQLGGGAEVLGESGHTVDLNGNVTNQQYTYGIKGLVDGEYLAGLTNTTGQTTDRIALNTTNLKDADGHTGTTLDAGTYENLIKIDFTKSDIQASEHFKKSNYKDTNNNSYVNGEFVVEKRLVGVSTDAERVYGQQTSDMSITNVTTTGKESSVEYSKDDLFTDPELDKRAHGLTGLVYGDGAGFDTNTFITKETNTNLDWLDVKYDAETDKVLAYVDNNTDEELNRITTTAKDTGVGKNYIVVAGDETLQINKAKLSLTVSGRKTYGEETGTTGDNSQYTFTVTGLNSNEKIGTNIDG